MCMCVCTRVCACVCTHGGDVHYQGRQEPARSRPQRAEDSPTVRLLFAEPVRTLTRPERAPGEPPRASPTDLPPQVPYPTPQTPLCPSCPCAYLGLGSSDADRRGGSGTRPGAADAGISMRAHRAAGARASLTRVLGGGARHSPNPSPSARVRGGRRGRRALPVSPPNLLPRTLPHSPVETAAPDHRAWDRCLSLLPHPTPSARTRTLRCGPPTTCTAPAPSPRGPAVWTLPASVPVPAPGLSGVHFPGPISRATLPPDRTPRAAARLARPAASKGRAERGVSGARGPRSPAPPRAPPPARPGLGDPLRCGGAAPPRARPRVGRARGPPRGCREPTRPRPRPLGANARGAPRPPTRQATRSPLLWRGGQPGGKGSGGLCTWRCPRPWGVRRRVWTRCRHQQSLRGPRCRWVDPDDQARSFHLPEGNVLCSLSLNTRAQKTAFSP